MTVKPGSDEGAQRRSDDDPLVRGEVAFRLLVEAVVDYAIFLLGPDGRVLTWNRGAERTKGYAADQIIGQHFSAFYTPEDRADGRPDRLLGLAAEYGRCEDEGWRVRQDGTRFWADIVITALREAPGEPPYAYVKITRDLTSRREAEEQQRSLLAEQRARAAAEQALSARDRFLSIASHELKTPVASLQLATESLILARDQGRLDDERLGKVLARISSAAERLGALLNELLDVSRLTADGPTLHAAVTDITALVHEVVARFSEHDLNDRIRLTAAPNVLLEADASRLDQVVTNLLENALKYSSSTSPVEVYLGDTGDAVEIRVADRGIGLDEETKDRIFEAFGRGANAEHYQGIGLGLFISQQVVALHGGRVEASGRSDGPGSIFTVTLPRRAPSA